MDTKAQIKQETELTATTGKLLNVQEREACEKLSDGTTPHSQWAQALLAIDDGASQAEAAQRAGLTSHQVKYWLAKFRKQGLGIFPQQASESTTQDIPASEPDMPIPERPAETGSQELKELETEEMPDVAEDEETIKPKTKKPEEKKKGKKGKGTGKKKDGKKRKTKKGKKSKKSGKGKKKKARKDKR